MGGRWKWDHQAVAMAYLESGWRTNGELHAELESSLGERVDLATVYKLTDRLRLSGAVALRGGKRPGSDRLLREFRLTLEGRRQLLALRERMEYVVVRVDKELAR